MIAIGPITDSILKRKLLTVLQARKISTAVSLIFPALFYVLAGYSGCNATLVLVYFSLASALKGASGKMRFIFKAHALFSLRCLNHSKRRLVKVKSKLDIKNETFFMEMSFNWALYTRHKVPFKLYHF